VINIVKTQKTITFCTKFNIFRNFFRYYDEEDLHLETLSVSIQQELINSFKDYFPDIPSNNTWIKDPFSVDIEKERMLYFSEQEVDNLIEISCDTDLKKVFEIVPLINFCCAVKRNIQA